MDPHRSNNSDIEATIDAANNFTCSSLTCYDISVSGQSVLQALYTNIAIGAFFFFLFVAFRTCPVYIAKLKIPNIKHRPPPMTLNGIKRLYSFITPIFYVSDRELLRIAGMDALLWVRITAFAVALFVPISIICLVVIIPVNYIAGNFIETQVGLESYSDLTYSFLRTTMSNISHDSSLMWIHFTILVLFVVWTMYLIGVYYEEYVALQYMSVNIDIHDLRAEASLNGIDATRKRDASPEDELATLGEMMTGGIVGKKETSSLGGRISEESKGQLIEDTPGGGGDTLDARIELWPVPRDFSADDAPKCPLHAGMYTVLVVDDSKRQFFIKRNPKFAKLGQGTSLQQDQYKWDAKTNYLFWMKKHQKEKEKSKDVESGSGVDAKSAEIKKIDSTHAGQDTDGKERNIEVQHSKLFPAFFRTDPSKILLENSEEFYHEDEEGDQISVDVEARMRYVDQTFRELFADDYDNIVPMYDTRRITWILTRLYFAQVKRDRLKHDLDALAMDCDDKKRKYLSIKLDLAKSKEDEWQARAMDATKAAFEKGCCNSFVAVFRTPIAAAQARSMDLNPVNQRSFYLKQGLDPGNMNYHALERPWAMRIWRTLLMLPMIVVIIGT